ncbi:hypothetical protein HU200_035781 [Digitaria exilis]|uniref:Uncharacterized protein n=1 Tax=Digitaria exilis TaxID=1010633 RepID=A0A835BEG7_9POAL|nr:hypothetical protein HU200_035781 [Digitaria exilis]
MEAALRGIRGKLTEHREKVVSALLLGSFVVLGWRSAEQQREIEDLEAEKKALRAANASMSTAMWNWREELFSLAATPSSPISVSRLRHIYGEEETAPPAAADQPGGYFTALCSDLMVCFDWHRRVYCFRFRIFFPL